MAAGGGGLAGVFDRTARLMEIRPRQGGRTDEAFRLECEARSWLRQGYTTAEAVDELMVRIRKHRGNDATERLRQEMRRQWATRAEWLSQERRPNA